MRRNVRPSCRRRLELPPDHGEQYYCFLDSASGIAKGGDSMAMGIASVRGLYDDSNNRPLGDVYVLDFVREVQPPFESNAVAADFAKIMRSYGISRCVTDRFSYGWVEPVFREHGIFLEYSQKTKSEIYLAALPLLGSGSIRLLDNSRLKAQILNLERRVARGGHESVDHPTGNFHDDLANVALGALVLAHVANNRPRTILFGV
jgi:hypothetical protein